jgi:hypothetical protein
MSNFKVQFCYNSSAGKSGVLYATTTGGSGVATYQWIYPSNGTAYALYAQAGTTNGNQPQTMASSPVQLTVGLNTTILLTVSRQNSSDTHTFMARLVNSNGAGVPNRLLTLELNDTAHEYNATTNNTGNATWTLSLSPMANDSATTYNIIISFAGDSPVKTATASLDTPNGTSYAVCTTTQYSTYKPSANSTSVLVMPQTTTGVTSLQSPEQAQAYAKSKNWLTVYPEFSWWYPWFRLHFKITISDPTTIDAGVPLLPGGSTQSSSGLSIFSQLDAQLISLFVWDAGTLMGEYVAARESFWVAPLISAFFLLGEGVEDAAILWSQWNNKDAILAFGIVNIIMGFIAAQGNLATAFINLLSMVSTAVMVALVFITTGMMATGGPPIANPVNFIQVGLSFGLAAVALAHWAGWI